jgi:hypothetical protein
MPCSGGVHIYGIARTYWYVAMKIFNVDPMSIYSNI